MWCLCSNNILPTIVSIDDQQISIQIDVNGKPFGITTVYASTCYISRRSLWSAISLIHSQHNIPWSCIGDFNTILGSHEHQGKNEPARLSMTDWHEKSKVKWHCEGDRNTSYFHRVAKIRNVSSHINTMKSGDITMNDPKLISAHVVIHFTNMFTNSSNIIQNGLIEEVVPN